MKRKNLIRKKQLYSTEIDTLCAAGAIIHELFMFSENVENQSHFCSMSNDIAELLRELQQHNYQYVERVPITKGE